MTDPTMPKDPSDNVLEAIDRYTTSLGIYCAARDALIAEQSKPQQIEYEQFDLERALAGESVFNIDGEERKITRHAFNDKLFIVHLPHDRSLQYKEEELHATFRMKRRTKKVVVVLYSMYGGGMTTCWCYPEEMAAFRGSLESTGREILLEFEGEIPIT